MEESRKREIRNSLIEKFGLSEKNANLSIGLIEEVVVSLSAKGETMNLSKSQRQALQAEGMTGVTLVEENIGNRGENLLLRGRNQHGDTVWGTWEEGGDAKSIRWTPIKANA